MAVAFVLSGGGSLGAVQVGMLQALGAHGVRPDLLVGTSVGAVNAAWVAGHGMGATALGELAAVWRSLRRHDVFDTDAVRALQAVSGRAPSLCSGRGLRALVARHAGFDRLEDSAVPLHVVATDLLTGEEVLVSGGDVTTAVLASAAIPGVFPPVPIDGRHLVDGGVADHTAVGRAVDLGASEIYVLPAGYPCALASPPRTALGSAVHALTLLIEQRLIGEVARYAGAATIRVLPPLCPLGVSAHDFRHADDLVERARRTSSEWLTGGGVDLPHQERFLSLHSHAVPVRKAPRPEAVS